MASGLEIITGQGSFRKGWASGPTLHQAAVRCLATLQVPWAEVSCNAGRLRVSLDGNSVFFLQKLRGLLIVGFFWVRKPYLLDY